jgi:DnaA family protein
VRRDLHTLTAILDAIDKYSLETQRQVTLPLVKDILKE